MKVCDIVREMGVITINIAIVWVPYMTLHLTTLNIYWMYMLYGLVVAPYWMYMLYGLVVAPYWMYMLYGLVIAPYWLYMLYGLIIAPYWMYMLYGLIIAPYWLYMLYGLVIAPSLLLHSIIWTLFQISFSIFCKIPNRLFSVLKR